MAHKSSRSRLVGVAVAVAALTVAAPGLEAKTFEIMVPAADGTLLATDVYLVLRFGWLVDHGQQRTR